MSIYTATMWKEFVCDICSQPFVSEADWDVRHSGPDGEEYHDSCCPECNEDWKLEEAEATAP